MPLEWVCIGDTYADALHMDMLNISFLLSFSPKIRKKVIPEVADTLMILRKTLGNVRQLEFFSLRYRQTWLGYR